jgi:hypothetical protein
LRCHTGGGRFQTAGRASQFAIELAGARHQGELIAKTANKLFG